MRSAREDPEVKWREGRNEHDEKSWYKTIHSRVSCIPARWRRPSCAQLLGPKRPFAANERNLGYYDGAMVNDIHADRVSLHLGSDRRGSFSGGQRQYEQSDNYRGQHDSIRGIVQWPDQWAEQWRGCNEPDPYR